MHHNVIIKDGDTTKDVKKVLVDGVQFVDDAPIEGSSNLVSSNGVAKAISDTKDAVDEETADLQEQIDDIAEKAGSGYIPKGEATVATLNGLSGQENGELYTMTDAGTLTDGSLAVVAGDTVAWDATNSAWYKAMDYAPSQYGTNEVHNLPTSITAFRAGDYIAVDGPSGTAKMPKDDLLKVTAENAKDAWGNYISDEFDVLYDKSRKSVTIADSSSPSIVNYKGLVKAGKRIKIHFNTTTWAVSDLPDTQRMLWITTRDGGSGSIVVETIAEVLKTAGSIASDYEYTFTSDANNLYITIRGNAGETISFDVSDAELETIKENVSNVENLSEFAFAEKSYTCTMTAGVHNPVDIPLVPIKGAKVKLHFDSTTWAISSLAPYELMLYITTRNTNDPSIVVETIVRVPKTAGSIASDYEYTFTSDAADLLRVTFRGDTSESVSFSVELIPVGLDDVNTEVKNLKKITVNPSYSLFAQGTLNTATGKENISNTRVRSDFIRVEGEFDVAAIAPYTCYVLMYDSDFNYINSEGIYNGTNHFNFDGYIRLRVQKADDSELLLKDVDFTKISFPLPETMPFDIVNELNRDSANNIRSADVWKRFDELCVKYPNYITKTLLCTEDSGLPIYYYTCGSGEKKIAIVGGQHGPKSDPRDGVITLCRLIEDICQNRFNGGVIGDVKDGCTLLVLPCLNPYGFDNYNPIVDNDDHTPGGRNNYNGVNLNRDWGAFTQPETQAAKVVLDAFEPDICVDLHTTGDFPTQNSQITGTQWVRIGNNEQSISSDFVDVINSKHFTDYSISVISSDPTIVRNNGTLVSYALYTLESCSATIETQWFVAGINQLHDAQVESANYSLLTNGLKFMLCRKFGGNYSYERTLPQLKA